jgi:hypothetical protein
MYFSRVFASTIFSFSSTERSKYPNPIPPPDPDDNIISEQIAKKISKTVTHYRSTNYQLQRSHNNDPRCPLTLPERRMKIWIEELHCDEACIDCCCLTYNHSDMTELLKTLLLYGEMETLLKIVAHSSISLTSKWDLPWQCGGGLGIGELMRCALMSYIFLNVVYLHTETWELSARRNWVAEKRKAEMVVTEQEVDYRRMVAWEKIVSRCTGMRGYDVHTSPHRLFYGVSKQDYMGNKWNDPGCGRKLRKHPSLLTEEERRKGEKYLPVFGDVDTVLFYFHCKEVPTEIGLQILVYADFKPERRLPIANDPLDPRNREELRKYLSWCWKVLVRCDVLMKASGNRIGWLIEITFTIRELFGFEGQNTKMFEWLGWEEKEAALYEEDENGNNVRALGTPSCAAMFI